MHRMLRSRISRRVITGKLPFFFYLSSVSTTIATNPCSSLSEQHIALTSQFRERQRKGTANEVERRVGVVDTRLNAAEVARKCAELIAGRGGPEGMVPVVLEGELEATFAFIPEHLE